MALPASLRRPLGREGDGYKSSHAMPTARATVHASTPSSVEELMRRFLSSRRDSMLPRADGPTTAPATTTRRCICALGLSLSLCGTPAALAQGTARESAKADDVRPFR